MASRTVGRVSAIAASATAALLCMTSPTSHATALVLTAVADSIVLDGSDSIDPYPGILASELGTGSAQDVWLSVLKFDLSSLVGMQIDSAALELTSNFNHSEDSFSHQMYSSSDDSWTEQTVNGINRPADSTLTLLSATNIDGVSGPYRWDVLAGVAGAAGLGGAGTSLTLMVRPDLAQTGSVFGPHFYDRSHSSGVPRLLLNVSPVPEVSTSLLLALGLVGIGLWRETAQRRHLASPARWTA